MAAYYNEIDQYAAEWLRNLIKAGHIADGEVDTRSIVDVDPNDLRQFSQCHFFAGIAGWSHALRLAGWADDRQIWTGSCPCQPFSAAGKGKGVNDERHLWPHFFRLIRSCRPSIVMGEQVAGAAGYGWLDGVKFDLESEDYSCESADLAAASVNAPHIRSRIFWVADTKSGRRRVQQPSNIWKASAEINTSSNDSAGGVGATRFKNDMADADSERRQQIAGSAFSNEEEDGREGWDKFKQDCDNVITSNGESNFWSDAIWLTGADGKTRRAQPGVCLLAHGVPARVGKLRAYGNAIVPPLAAEVIKAFMDTQ